MKLLFVSVAIEFPLTPYCLAAQINANPCLSSCSIEQCHLNWDRLSSYERKNSEIWCYIDRLESWRPDVVAFSVYLWNHLAIEELIAITSRVYPEIRVVVGGPELATCEVAETWLKCGAEG